MKKIIRLTEGDLRRIVKRSVNRILKESMYDFSILDGEYEVYFEDGIKEAVIDTNEPYVSIGDYTLYDEEAMDAIGLKSQLLIWDTPLRKTGALYPANRLPKSVMAVDFPYLAALFRGYCLYLQT